MLQVASAGHAPAYGGDQVTRNAEQLFRQHFGESARSYLVGTGTAANVIGLRSVTDSYHSIIAADCSHLHWDECGALERFTGCKLLLAKTRHGKIDPDGIAPHLRDTDMVHRAQPKVVSISQCTELGTVYSIEELRRLAEFCHGHDLLLHVDGARLCNAAVALDATLAQLTSEVGVDLLSFGGTKNGLLAAEAIVVLRPAIAEQVEFYRKQGMQLTSKMRFVAAQLVALLQGELWRENASHSNAMARLLADQVEGIEQIDIVHPVQTNVVFARIPQAWVATLQQHCQFHVWDSHQCIVRWMTSFDTTEEDIEAFTRLLRSF